MHITQKNIAKAAQVSQALVSLVLSENAGGASSQKPLRVSPETRQKVLDTAKRLGYREKASLRPVTGESSLWFLGCLPPDEGTAGDNWRQVIEASRGLLTGNALLEALSRQGRALSMRLLAPESDLRSALRAQAVGGVFLGSAIPELRELLGPAVPIISMGGRFLPEGDLVLADEREVMGQAVEFLHENGHTRIALMAAGPEPDVAIRRGMAFEEAAEEWGIDFCDWDAEGLDVTQFLDRILDPLQPAETRPTAVIADESLAMALQAEAVRRGCVLPEDLSLLALGGSATSVLTTSGVCAGEMAHAAVMLMHERQLNPGEAVVAHRKIEIAPTVTDRGSVARQTEVTRECASASLIVSHKPDPAILFDS